MTVAQVSFIEATGTAQVITDASSMALALLACMKPSPFLTPQTEGRSGGRCRRKEPFCFVPGCDTVADEMGVPRAQGDAGIRNTVCSKSKR